MALVDDKITIKCEGNHIYFYAEVDRDSTYQLIECLKEAEEFCVNICNSTNIENMPIYLHINSYGGCLFSALNVIDYILSSKYPVYTIVEGSVASAGTLMSVVGVKRFIRPNAHMLIHQLSSECWGKMNEIEDEFINLKELMGKIKKIYKKHTTIPKKDLKGILKRDLWLNSNKCLEFGLVDELWINPK